MQERDGSPPRLAKDGEEKGRTNHERRCWPIMIRSLLFENAVYGGYVRNACLSVGISSISNLAGSLKEGVTNHERRCWRIMIRSLLCEGVLILSTH